MKTFAELFKKYRLRAEFGTFTEFTDALAEKGYNYETSLFSHWQKGTRLPSPSNRNLVLTIVEIFIERDSIKNPQEANEFLASTGLGNLTEQETDKVFYNESQETQVSEKYNIFEQLNKLIFVILAITGIVLLSIYSFIDFKNIIVSLIFCINFILSLLLYLQSKKTPALFAMMVLAFSVSAGCLATIFYRASSAENAIIAAKFLYVSPTAVPTSFLLFSLLFPEDKVNKSIIALLVAVTVIMAMLPLIKDAFIINVITPQGKEKIALFGWAYYIYIFYYPIFFISGYYVLFKKYLKATHYRKQQILFIFLGMVGLSAFGMVTNLLLPTLGNVDFNWLGPACTIFWLGGVYMAVAKYRLFNLHLLFKKFLK